MRSLFVHPVLPGLVPPLHSFSIPSLFSLLPSPLLPSSPLPSPSLPSPPLPCPFLPSTLPQPCVLPPPLRSGGTEGWSVHPHSQVRPVALSYVYGRCIEKMTVSPICWTTFKNQGRKGSAPDKILKLLRHNVRTSLILIRQVPVML